MAMRSHQARQVEISLAGDGGQGLILGGIILAEAAGVYDGRQVVQTQTYGPASRGGKCRSDVIISDEEIDALEIERPDVLVVLSIAAANAYAPTLRPGGILLLDSGLALDVRPGRATVYALPFAQRAQEQVGSVLYTNIIALGALAALTNVVSVDALRRAVLARAPKGTAEPNCQALTIGMKLGESAGNERSLGRSTPGSTQDTL